MERVPRLHLVTDDDVLADAAFTARALEALEAADHRVALHLRGPGTPARTLYHLAAALLPEARRAGVLLVVNDRLDVAAAVDAPAVQLGGRSLEPGTVRSLRDRGFLASGVHVGLSVHAPDEARQAGSDAHWLLVGTLFATPSHPERPGAGPGLLKAVAEVSALPLVGIGGVTPPRVARVVEHGGHGVAALRGVWAPPGGSTGEAVRDYLQALDNHTSKTA